MRKLMCVMPINEDVPCVWCRARSDVSFESEFHLATNICIICALLYMLEIFTAIYANHAYTADCVI